jgi:DNA-binding NarL/FixJ family response regulator
MREEEKKLPKRNLAIINALEDGYKQVEVARHLDLFPAAVSKVSKFCYRWQLTP